MSAEKVTIGDAELWHGDCREVLPLLPRFDLVLDCFMGSGTTGEAAHLEGRRFIGMERETEYFQGIAVPRVRAAAQQQPLLPPDPQPVAEQQGFDLE